MMENVELLRAAIAMAVADGKISRSEMGVVEGLAQRAGVGAVAIEAMFEAASKDESFSDNLQLLPKDRSVKAVELLVGLARIDGEISSEEHELVVRIAASLGIVGDEFQQVYEAGIKRADNLRKAH
jgi:uncharacterized tellurite resistance protein B-like protein